MMLMEGHLHRLPCTGEGSPPDIERPGLFAEVIDAFTVGAPQRIAVFAPEGGDLPMSRVFGIERPNIAGCLGNGVFAPLVFLRRAVGVEQCAPIRTGRYVERLEGNDQPLTATGDR